MRSATSAACGRPALLAAVLAVLAATSLPACSARELRQQVVVAAPGQLVQVTAPPGTTFLVGQAGTPAAVAPAAPAAPAALAAPAVAQEAPLAASAPSRAGGTGSLGDPELQGVWDAHNAARAAHRAGPLGWSADLAAAAQAWAERCVFQHSGPGENLAQNFPNFGAAMRAWMAEEASYRWDGQFSYATGHFTEIVWRGVRELGCGYAPRCSLYVCHYSPPGNVIGQFQARRRARPRTRCVRCRLRCRAPGRRPRSRRCCRGAQDNVLPPVQ
ncbi:PRY1 [Scenedesmus sp. PABB004]|nr:PRY1 [Scenedesmus sp. PABB004]